jgi:hypothetical protein
VGDGVGVAGTTVVLVESPAGVGDGVARRVGGCGKMTEVEIRMTEDKTRQRRKFSTVEDSFGMNWIKNRWMDYVPFSGQLSRWDVMDHIKNLSRSWRYLRSAFLSNNRPLRWSSPNSGLFGFYKQVARIGLRTDEKHFSSIRSGLFVEPKAKNEPYSSARGSSPRPGRAILRSAI